MDRTELLERISAFPLAAAELSTDLLAGDFRSVFKAQGIEFDEVRPYERGDDARSIDWNVSARFGSPYLKLYREERELSVFLVLDLSPSMSTGGLVSRRDQALLASALLALCAEKTGERFGAALFSAGIDRLFPPRKGRSQAMAFIEAALEHESSGCDSALPLALSGAARLLKHRSLVIVISDFLSLGWEESLGLLARRHDVIAIRVSSPTETSLPDAGLVALRDPETGILLHAPTGFASFREAWEDWHRDRAAAWHTACVHRGAATLELSTADDVCLALRRFFGSRRHA